MPRPLCKCQCGAQVLDWNSWYLPGHHEQRGRMFPLIEKTNDMHPCACGCKMLVSLRYEFHPGHNRRRKNTRARMIWLEHKAGGGPPGNTAP